MRKCKYDETPKPKKKKQEDKEPAGGKKEWKDMTPLEVNAFKREVCWHCEYLGKMDGKISNIDRAACCFSDMNGFCRLCSPLECKERGFFKQRTYAGRRQMKCLNVKKSRNTKRASILPESLGI